MIELQHLTKQYGEQVAVRDLSLTVGEGELLVLLGGSGSGKTTTLKMINRLIEPSAGSVLVDGRDVAELEPYDLRRRIGYAFQQVGLFPHMTVAENVGVTPALLGWTEGKIHHRVNELLELFVLCFRKLRSHAGSTRPQSVWESPPGGDTGSGHRAGPPEGRIAPHEAPGDRHGGGQERRAQQQRAKPTGRAAEKAFHHPANDPARDEEQTQPDPHQRIHQLQQGRAVSKAVEREEGLQGHHARPASHWDPPGAPCLA